MKSGNHEMPYAWEVTNLDGRKVIYHFGGTYGFTSYFGFIEGSKTGVIVLTNTKVRMNELAINILRKLALDLPKKK